MREELLKGLTEEQKKKVAECNSSEEVLARAKKEGVTLTDEQLEAVSGGCGGGSSIKCKNCGSKDVDEIRYEYGTPGTPDYRGYEDRYQCNKCGYRWYDRHRINPNNTDSTDIIR